MYSIYFPLIYKTKKTFFAFIKYFLFSSFLFVLFSTLFFDIKNPIVRLSIFLFLIANLFWIGASIIVKKYKIIGEIKFGENCITVYDKDIFNLCEINNLKVNYKGFDGEPYGMFVGGLESKDGSRNWIEFEYKNLIYKFNFYISDYSKAQALNYFIKKWKENNIHIELLDYFGKPIDSIK